MQRLWLLVFLALVVSAQGVTGRCPVQAPKWGSVRERTLKDGTLQTLYSCDGERKLRGHKVLNCTDDGVWNHPIPTCVTNEDLFFGHRLNGQLDHGKNNIRSRRQKHPKKHQQQQQQLQKDLLAKLNDTFIEKLDASCYGKLRIGKLVKPPIVNNAKFVKYARKSPLFNRYQVVVYECNEQYELKNSEQDRLYCSNGAWLGDHPECVKKEAESIERCDSTKVCEQLCDDVEDGIRCSCFVGFQLVNKTSCVDFDECEIDNGGCSHTCRNNRGSFYCECPDGYHLEEDHKTCKDTDECEPNGGRGPCEQSCNNLAGGYMCSCDEIPGYKLKPDNHTCEDLDECTVNHNNGGCSHECVNTVGSFFCLCPTGYELADDDKTCKDVDECRDSICKSREEECVNSLGSYKCIPKLKKKNQSLPEDDYDAENDDEDEDEDEDGDDDYDEGITESSVYESCEIGYKKDDKGECIDIDECSEEFDDGSSHGCDHHCINTNGSYYCNCHDGYELNEDAVTCTELENPCSKTPKPCSHICKNVAGSYECSCPAGYTLKSDNSSCEEILLETCANLKTPCSHSCQDTDSGPKCICPHGFELANDHVTCEDECMRGNHQCSHFCHHENGTYSCSCPIGMSLMKNLKTCLPSKSCEELNCAHDCVKQKNDSGHYCECLVGYTLEEDGRSCSDFDECLDDDEPYLCSYPSFCVNIPGSYRCECPQGLVLDSDGYSCRLQDPCANASCAHKCVPEGESFRCECPEGLVLDSDEYTCKSQDPCANASCAHKCIPKGESFMCECNFGYELETNGFSCKCNSTFFGCSHNCIEKDASHECTCPPHWFLSQDLKTCVIDENYCFRMHGCSHTCEEDENRIRCGCPEGYELSADEKTCKSVYDACSIENGGCSHTCQFEEGIVRCSCPSDLILDKDNLTCTTYSLCTKSNGGCSHSCESYNNEILCKCPSGMRLGHDNLTCIDDYDDFENNVQKSENPCDDGNNGGCEQICQAENGQAICSCRDGFYSLESNNSRCFDKNECEEDHDCENLCVNTHGSYECRCNPGYEMKNHLCVDINECEEFENDVNGCSFECLNIPGSYRCVCPDGHILANDSHTCTAIDKCALNNGGCEQVCQTENGQAVCSCNPGYEMKNHVCVDVSECDNNNGNCEQICINNLGSYTCSCNSGFYVDRRNTSQCLDLNECLYHNGHCNGDCINTFGSYYCVCADDLVLAPDERTCISKSNSKCLALQPPTHGEIRCPGHPSGAEDYPLGAKCHVRCRRGFRLEGSYLRTCEAGGRWDGHEPVCIRDYAPETHPYYNVFATTTTTTTQAPRPYIRCPGDIDVELQPRRNTARVTFSQPKTNVDWYRYVDASPAWAKQLHADLPPGDTVLTFTAWTPASNYTSVCRMMIRVRDTESPRILSCPTSYEVWLNPGERDREIYWQEPVFTDNVRIERTYKSREPGQLLHPGVHNVRYIASDAAGNRAECHFTIHIREAERRPGAELETQIQPQPPTYQRMLICPNRPPQEVPLSHRWQIPSGCYMRYTRLFSGTYTPPQQRYHAAPAANGAGGGGGSHYQRRSEFQSSDTATAYHEVHPLRRAPGTVQTRAYPLVDCKYESEARQQQEYHRQRLMQQQRHYHHHQQQQQQRLLQLQRPRGYIYYPRSRQVVRTHHEGSYSSRQTRLLQTRPSCCPN